MQLGRKVDLSENVHQAGIRRTWLNVLIRLKKTNARMHARVHSALQIVRVYTLLIGGVAHVWDVLMHVLALCAGGNKQISSKSFRRAFQLGESKVTGPLFEGLPESPGDVRARYNFAKSSMERSFRCMDVK